MTSEVIGVGDGVPAAAAFAAATSRPFREIASLGDLVHARPGGSGAVTSCLVSAGSAVSTRDVWDATRAALDAGIVLGWIPGWAGARAGVAVAEKMARYGWGRHRGTLLSGGFGGLRGVGGRVEILPSTEPELRDRLRAGHAVIGVQTHGNGIDAPLGGAVLCSLADHGPVSAPDHRFFACGHGGPCLRSRVDQGYLKPPERFSAAWFRADVVIWATCWGLLCADSVFDPRASLAAGFAASPHNGALLTTWKDSSGQELAVMFAALMLDRGASLGEAWQWLNSVATAQGEQPGWVLLGDPDVRIASARADLAPESLKRDGIDIDVPPGLFAVDLGVDAVGVAARAADDAMLSPGVFALRPIPAMDRAVGVLLTDRRQRMRLRSWTPHTRPDKVEMMAAIWGSTSYLRFSSLFLDLARRNPRARFGDQHVADMLRNVEAWIEEGLRHPASQVDAELSGPSDPLARQHAYQARAWRVLNAQLLTALTGFCGSVGGVLHLTYGDLARSTRVPTERTCPYCGLPLDAELVHSPFVDSNRIRLTCPRCTLISDAPEVLGSMWLQGSERLVTGAPAVFRVQPEAWPTGWALAGATLTTGGEVPWQTEEPAQQDFLEGAELPATLAPTISFPTGVPTGRYFLLAPVVVNGAIGVARRPVLVENEDGAPPDGPAVSVASRRWGG